jgi:hypothetical protein
VLSSIPNTPVNEESKSPSLNTFGTQGTIRVHHSTDNTVIRTLTRGQCFGDIACITGKKHSASVRCGISEKKGDAAKNLEETGKPAEVDNSNPLLVTTVPNAVFKQLL